MKQVKRAETENEKMENIDNYNARADDDNANNTTAEAKRQQDKGGQLYDRSKGQQGKGRSTS